MCFLAQNRHKTKAPIRQVTVNKRKYENDLDPSLGKGVPLTWIRGDQGGYKSSSIASSTQLLDKMDGVLAIVSDRRRAPGCLAAELTKCSFLCVKPREAMIPLLKDV